MIALEAVGGAAAGALLSGLGLGAAVATGCRACKPESVVSTNQVVRALVAAITCQVLAAVAFTYGGTFL